QLACSRGARKSVEMVPLPPLVDADRDHVIALGIEGPQNRSRRDDRDLVFRRAPAEYDGDPPAASAARAHSFSSACRKSSTRSSGSSPPTDTRRRPSPIPAALRASADSCRWLELAGWQTSVCRPPNDDPTRATCRASQTGAADP